MKKILLAASLILLTILIVIAVAGYHRKVQGTCRHEWEPACENPAAMTGKTIAKGDK